MDKDRIRTERAKLRCEYLDELIERVQDGRMIVSLFTNLLEIWELSLWKELGYASWNDFLSQRFNPYVPFPIRRSGGEDFMGMVHKEINRRKSAKEHEDWVRNIVRQEINRKTANDMRDATRIEPYYRDDVHEVKSDSD